MISRRPGELVDRRDEQLPGRRRMALGGDQRARRAVRSAGSQSSGPPPAVAPSSCSADRASPKRRWASASPDDRARPRTHFSGARRRRLGSSGARSDRAPARPPSTSSASARLRAAPAVGRGDDAPAVSIASRPCPAAKAASANSASSSGRSARWPAARPCAARRPLRRRRRASGRRHCERCGSSHRSSLPSAIRRRMARDRRVPSSSRAPGEWPHPVVVPARRSRRLAGGRSPARRRLPWRAAAVADRRHRRRHVGRSARRSRRSAATPVASACCGAVIVGGEGMVDGPPVRRRSSRSYATTLEHRPPGPDGGAGDGRRALEPLQFGERRRRRGRAARIADRTTRDVVGRVGGDHGERRANGGASCGRGPGPGRWPTRSEGWARRDRPRVRPAGQGSASGRAGWRPSSCPPANDAIRRTTQSVAGTASRTAAAPAPR